MLVRLRKDGKFPGSHCRDAAPIKEGYSRPSKSEWAGKVIEVEPTVRNDYYWNCNGEIFVVTDERLTCCLKEGKATICEHYFQPNEEFDELDDQELLPWEQELEAKAKRYGIL